MNDFLPLAAPVAPRFTATLRDVAYLREAVVGAARSVGATLTHVHVSAARGMDVITLDEAATMLVNIHVAARAFSVLEHTLDMYVSTTHLADALAPADTGTGSGKKRAAAPAGSATFSLSAADTLDVAVNDGAPVSVSRDYGEFSNLMVEAMDAAYAIEIATTSARALLSLLREGADDKTGTTTIAFAPRLVTITGGRASITYPTAGAAAPGTPAALAETRTVKVATKKFAKLLTFTNSAVTSALTLGVVMKGLTCVQYILSDDVVVRLCLSPIVSNDDDDDDDDE